MICYQCQGSGVRLDHPGWPCPLCQGQRFLHCCEGDVEQPEPQAREETWDREQPEVVGCGPAKREPVFADA